jgi:hypothetical protein
MAVKVPCSPIRKAVLTEVAIFVGAHDLAGRIDPKRQSEKDFV